MPAGVFLCWNIAGASFTSGSAVNIYACHGGANQKWTLNPGGEISPKGYEGTLCLDVIGGSTSNDAKLQVYSCNKKVNQHWVIRGAVYSAASASPTALTAAEGAYCLDIPSSKTANGTPVNLFGCHTGANQRWDYWP